MHINTHINARKISVAYDNISKNDFAQFYLR